MPQPRIAANRIYGTHETCQSTLANYTLTQEYAVVGKNDDKKEKKRRAKTEISVAVGKAIAERRKIARMTQQKVAEVMGVEKETISRMESGETAQSVDRLASLGKILGCSVRDFFEEEKRDANPHVDAIEYMIAPLSTERQERVVRCVAEIVGAWDSSIDEG